MIISYNGRPSAIYVHRYHANLEYVSRILNSALVGRRIVVNNF
jgi:hypothetical protein